MLRIKLDIMNKEGPGFHLSALNLPGGLDLGANCEGNSLV